MKCDQSGEIIKAVFIDFPYEWYYLNISTLSFTHFGIDSVTSIASKIWNNLPTET